MLFRYWFSICHLYIVLHIKILGMCKKTVEKISGDYLD